DAALEQLSPVFDQMYSAMGRPSVPPERLLKASLLMAFYSVRSERLFCEQLDYNLMFRWFLDMNMIEESFDHSTFSLNRERLLEHEVAARFLAAVVEQARAAGLMSDDHFTVDGTLIDAWASMKSFQLKQSGKQKPPDDPGNPSVDFRGEKRSNETHQSKTDPESELARRGPGLASRLAFSGHALMENRNGLLVDLRMAPANQSERVVALDLLEAHVERCRNRRRRPRLRRAKLCRGMQSPGHLATRDAISAPRLSDRRPHDTARRLPDQPAGPETSRRDLWLAQDSGEFPEDAIPRHREDATRS